MSPERLLWTAWHVGSLGFRNVPSFALGRKIKQSREVLACWRGQFLFGELSEFLLRFSHDAQEVKAFLSSQPEVLRLGGWGGVGLGGPEPKGGQQSSKQGCQRPWAGWPACPHPCRPRGLDHQGCPCLAVIFCAVLSILS